MVVVVMTEDGDRLTDLDELKLFGMFRECDEEIMQEKWKGDSHAEVGIHNIMLRNYDGRQ